MTMTMHEANTEIFRLPKDKAHPFTMISNDRMSFAQDSRLSSRAYGILCKALSLIGRNETEEGKGISGWHFTVSGFCKIMNDGETRIRSGLKELERLGYFVMEKPRDESGRFQKAVYRFSEIVQEAWLTTKKADQNPVEENGLDSSVLPHCDFPHVENPDGENQAQLKTNSNKKSVCLAEPTDRHHHKESKETDSLQKENRKENRNDAKQFMALEMLMKEHSGWDTMGQKLQKFTTDVIGYLKKSVLSGAVSSAKMTSKLIDIFNQEGTLLNFIKKINRACEQALKKLKCLAAKEKFLMKVICNQLEEYVPESPESSVGVVSAKQKEENSSCRSLNFHDMLLYMGHPGLREYSNWQTIFDNEENFKEFYGEFNLAEDSWCIQQCHIPDNFMDMPETLEQALKFLTGCSSPNAEKLSEQLDYQAFVGKTIHILAKTISHTKARNLLTKLNAIHTDKDHRDDSLHQFMYSFFMHFQDRVAQYPIRCNEEKYIAKMLTNYILHDYDAEEIVCIGKEYHLEHDYVL